MFLDKLLRHICKRFYGLQICAFAAHDECQPGIEELLRRSYAKGHDLVAWTQELLRVKQKFEEKSDLSYKATLTPTRRHIAGMWQVLFEQGAIFHGM